LTTAEKISISISVLAVFLPLIINFFQNRKQQKVNDQKYLKLNDFRNAQTKLTKEQNQIFQNINDNMTKFLEKFEVKTIQETQIKTNSKWTKKELFNEAKEVNKKPPPIRKKTKFTIIKK